MTELQANKVFAVVVTYEPDAVRLQQVLQAVAPQVQYLLIVDNSQTGQARDTTQLAVQAISATPDCFGGSEIEVHAAQANLGLSRAYNLAVQRARKVGASHLLLLDQDSVVAPDMVEALLRGLQRAAGEAYELGMQGEPVTVGPWYTDELTGRRSVILRTGRWLVNYIRPAKVTGKQELAQMPLMPSEMLISSGSMIPLEVFDLIGVLDAELFIDHIDTDWCLRVKHAGCWMAVVPDAQMQHQLGDHVLRLWLFRWRLLPVHSPLRLYYTFRNSLWLYVRPHAHWRWILFDLKRLCAVIVIHMLARGPRLPRIKMILKGLRDGIAGYPS